MKFPRRRRYIRIGNIFYTRGNTEKTDAVVQSTTASVFSDFIEKIVHDKSHDIYTRLDYTKVWGSDKRSDISVDQNGESASCSLRDSIELFSGQAQFLF